MARQSAAATAGRHTAVQPRLSTGPLMLAQKQRPLVYQSLAQRRPHAATGVHLAGIATRSEGGVGRPRLCALAGQCPHGVLTSLFPLAHSPACVQLECVSVTERTTAGGERNTYTYTQWQSGSERKREMKPRQRQNQLNDWVGLAERGEKAEGLV